MSNVRMVFSSDLQIASNEVIKEICLDINTRVVIITSYHAIDERWRRAISVAGNGCSVAVVRGSAKEKDKQTIFIITIVSRQINTSLYIFICKKRGLSPTSDF